LLSGTIYDAVGTAATQSFDNRNAGTGKTLTASGLLMADGNGGANYQINYVDNSAGVITPAALSIIADDKVRPVDAPNPAFTATYAGLVAGDTPASLSGTLELQTTATATSPEGSYPITPYGQGSSNYVIAYVDGTLVVAGNPDVPGLAIGAGYDPQAVAAQYSSPSPPQFRVPALRYATGTDAAGDDASSTTIRVSTGGLNVGR